MEVFYLVEETWGRGWCVGWDPGDGRAKLLGQGRDQLSQRLIVEVPRYAIPDGRSSTGEAYWSSKRRAALAMRMARLVSREMEDGVPWPRWAKQAIAEGWKPPRRWRPRRGLEAL